MLKCLGSLKIVFRLVSVKKILLIQIHYVCGAYFRVVKCFSAVGPKGSITLVCWSSRLIEAAKQMAVRMLWHFLLVKCSPSGFYIALRFGRIVTVDTK